VRNSILLVDDELDLLFSTKSLLEEDFEVFEASTLDKAREIIENRYIELVLLDITMPEGSGLDLLKIIKENYPETQVIMLTAVTDTHIAIKAIRDGAYDYILKPYDPEHLPLICKRAVEFSSLKKQQEGLLVQQEGADYFKIIGSSLPMKKVFSVIEKVKDKPVTITISGETGTGKELVARAIHYNGVRKRMPFIAINCSAIPKEIAESELFGHEKGAFTSADEPKAGKFELANGGTIFLDEINSLDTSLQAKVLRVIQEKCVTRVGGSRDIEIDIRIITATNQNLKELSEKGDFRQDLYHRINVIEIKLPSLKQRGKDEITRLVHHFISEYALQYRTNIRDISSDALKVLHNYSWPGNIRELQNIIERIVILEETRVIKRFHIPGDIRGDSSDKKRIPITSGPLKDRLLSYEREQVLDSLDQNKMNITITAKELGMHRTTLISKLKALDIDIEELRN